MDASNKDNNPYATPVDTAPGRYEWPLWRRIIYACSVIAIFYLAFAAIGSWNSFRHVSSIEHATPLEQIKAFFVGWDSLQGKDR